MASYIDSTQMTLSCSFPSVLLHLLPLYSSWNSASFNSTIGFVLTGSHSTQTSQKPSGSPLDSALHLQLLFLRLTSQAPSLLHPALSRLGVTLNNHLSLDQHVSSVSKSAFFHVGLRALRHIRSVLTEDIAKSIAVSLVSSCLDYCNSILYGTSVSNLRKIQRVQNRPGSHLGLRSRLDLAPKRLERRLSHHLMTRPDLSFRDLSRRLGRPFSSPEICAESDPPPFEHDDFDQYPLSASTVIASDKSSISSTNRKSTTRFPTSHR